MDLTIKEVTINMQKSIVGITKPTAKILQEGESISFISIRECKDEIRIIFADNPRKGINKMNKYKFKKIVETLEYLLDEESEESTRINRQIGFA